MNCGMRQRTEQVPSLLCCCCSACVPVSTSLLMHSPSHLPWSTAPHLWSDLRLLRLVPLCREQEIPGKLSLRAALTDDQWVQDPCQSPHTWYREPLQVIQAIPKAPRTMRAPAPLCDWVGVACYPVLIPLLIFLLAAFPFLRGDHFHISLLSHLLPKESKIGPEPRTSLLNGIWTGYVEVGHGGSKQDHSPKLYMILFQSHKKMQQVLRQGSNMMQFVL